VERGASLYTLRLRIKRRVGDIVMPVVVTPAGEWLQDSSVIIDTLEQRFPARPVVPVTPVQRFASYLLEMWADEFWIPTGLHTRWSHPENYALFEREAGDALLPGFPRVLKRRAAATSASMLRGYLGGVGIVPAQAPLLDEWISLQLDALERHFAELPYLLGARPSLADFALAGPMCAHLGRDPWPKQHLVAPRPHLRGWVERMDTGNLGDGALLDGDRLPATLQPLFASIFGEMLPYLEATLVELERALLRLTPGKRLPRGLGEVEFPLASGRYRRRTMPYVMWMLQRALDTWRQMPATDAETVRRWAAGFGGERLLGMQVPRLALSGLRIIPERSGGH
jgi:glutathione S-transferase